MNGVLRRIMVNFLENVLNNFDYILIILRSIGFEK
jgi:hypothetical protein